MKKAMNVVQEICNACGGSHPTQECQDKRYFNHNREIYLQCELDETLSYLILLERHSKSTLKNLGLGVVKYLKKPTQDPRGVGTNGETSDLASNEANSSGSSFWNVKTSSTSTTPIVNKIRKLKKLIIDGRSTLVDDSSKPMKKFKYPDNHDSKDEDKSVNNDMARFMASDSVGFGTKKKENEWKVLDKNIVDNEEDEIIVEEELIVVKIESKDSDES
nr:hypothetical protein [Tanacetum cinerariifolium]